MLLNGSYDKIASKESMIKWFYIEYEETKGSVFIRFSKLVNNEVKPTIINILIINPASDNELTFKY